MRARHYHALAAIWQLDALEQMLIFPVCGMPFISSVPPCPPLTGAPASMITVGVAPPDSLPSATASPAVHWAWIRYPRRGDDGAGIVASSVSPESESAL